LKVREPLELADGYLVLDPLRLFVFEAIQL